MKKVHNIKLDHTVRIDTSPEPRPPVTENWRARRELAAALRRLNTAVLTAEVPTEQLDALTQQLRDETARIEAQPHLAGRWGFIERYEEFESETPDVDLIYEMSPAVGQSNALALPMHIWADGTVVHGEVTADWAHEGPIGHLHGGIIALLFDQFLGMAQRSVTDGGRTGTLSIRFHQPTPLNRPLKMRAEVKRIEGRKKFIGAELWAGEVHTASCEGIFIADKTQD